MPEVSDDRLAIMARLLKTGPIVIGEDHEKGVARQAIIRLIAQRAVSYLSLESPIGPENMTRSDGQIHDTKKYFGSVTPFPNSQVAFKDLVQYARNYGIPVYFHDVPVKKSPLNFHGESDPDLKAKGTLTTYPNYAKQFLTANSRMADLPISDRAAANLYVHRNFYAANFLKAKLGNGVRVLFGLVILAGAFHVRADKSGKGRTLQNCLGIDPSRAFICE